MRPHKGWGSEESLLESPSPPAPAMPSWVRASASTPKAKGEIPKPTVRNGPGKLSHTLMAQVSGWFLFLTLKGSAFLSLQPLGFEGKSLNQHGKVRWVTGPAPCVLNRSQRGLQPILLRLPSPASPGPHQFPLVLGKGRLTPIPPPLESQQQDQLNKSRDLARHIVSFLTPRRWGGPSEIPDTSVHTPRSLQGGVLRLAGAEDLRVALRVAPVWTALSGARRKRDLPR